MDTGSPGIRNQGSGIRNQESGIREVRALWAREESGLLIPDS
jgi:hypothetical protein